MPQKNSSTQVTQRRKAALNEAATEVLPGNKHGGTPPQARIGTDGASKALNDYKDLAADYAQKAQVWTDAQELRDVRLEDLVKVHAHRPFDEDSAGRVARETAKAVESEKAALKEKQAAKKALDAAWATVRNFVGEAAIQPLIPDEDEDPDE